MEAIDAGATTNDGLAVGEDIKREAEARLPEDGRVADTGVGDGLVQSVPGEAGQRIRGGVVRSVVERGHPDGGADVVRVLPRAFMTDAQTVRGDEVVRDAPGVLTVEVRVPEIEIGVRIEVLLMPVLNLAFEEVREGVAAVEVRIAVGG